MKLEFTKAPDGFSYLISQKEAKLAFKKAFPDIENFRLKFVHKAKGIPSEIQYLATYDYSAFEPQVTIWAIPNSINTEEIRAKFENKIIPLMSEHINKHIRKVYSQNHSGYFGIVGGDSIYSFPQLNTYGLPSLREWKQAIQSGKAQLINN